MEQKLNQAYELLSDSLEYCTRIVNPSKVNRREYRNARGPRQYHRTQSTSGASEAGDSGNSGRRFWRDVVEHGFPDETVFEVFFESSYLVSAGYNPVSRILYQKFLGGNAATIVYRYFDVPLEVWNELLAASSHGSYAYWNINYSFRYERCSGPNRPCNAGWRFREGNHMRQFYQHV